MPESSPAATSLRADKRMAPNPSGRGPANRTCRSALECCQQLRQTPAATVQGCSRSRPLTSLAPRIICCSPDSAPARTNPRRNPSGNPSGMSSAIKRWRPILLSSPPPGSPTTSAAGPLTHVSSHKLALGHPLEEPLKIYPVSDLVNSPKTDDARCIEPVAIDRDFFERPWWEGDEGKS